MGDQILAVSGMPVLHSTHREVVSVIQGRPRLQLKVRSGGLIPVRERRQDPVSWRVVVGGERVGREEEPAPTKPGLAPPPVEDSDQCVEQRLHIGLQGQQGLGCSICKVSQHVKPSLDNSVARLGVNSSASQENHA